MSSQEFARSTDTSTRHLPENPTARQALIEREIEKLGPASAWVYRHGEDAVVSTKKVPRFPIGIVFGEKRRVVKGNLESRTFPVHPFDATPAPSGGVFSETSFDGTSEKSQLVAVLPIDKSNLELPVERIESGIIKIDGIVQPLELEQRNILGARAVKGGVQVVRKFE